jgi:hypothetical protein
MERPKKIITKITEDKKEIFISKELQEAISLQKQINVLNEKFDDYGSGAFNHFLDTFPAYNIQDKDECQEFFNCVDILKEIIEDRMKFSKGHQDLDGCIHELIRLQMVSKNAKENYEQAIRFMNTWNEISKNLYEPLFEIFEGGDDSYSDFLDIIPLAGKDIIGRCFIGGIYTNFDQLKNAIRKEIEANHRTENIEYIYDLIVRGENYASGKIKERLKYFFSSYIRAIEE